MIKPDNHVPNLGHHRNVQDFWHKLLLLMVTAQLQGEDDVIASRVRVGTRKEDGVDDSNIGWRIDKFFSNSEKMEHHWTKFSDRIPTYDIVEKEIQNEENKVVDNAVAKLIGRRQNDNWKYPLFNRNGSGFPHGANLKDRGYEIVEGQILFRIAVAFGFCPEYPRAFLELANEENHDPLSSQWIKELHFNPKRFDRWADADEGPMKNRQACAIWKAFAGQALEGDTKESWGESFEKFRTEWGERVSPRNEAELRAGVLVNDENKPVELFNTLEEYKKAMHNTNDQAARAVAYTAGEEIPVDTENSAFDLWWPEEVVSPEDLKGFDRLKYTSGIDDFLGREDEIKLLHDFAGDPSSGEPGLNFRWMLLTGDAGDGKTRLAYEFSRNELDDLWYKGKLLYDNLKAFRNPAEWRPVKPTFIVIDDVQTVLKEVLALLREFSCQARNYEFPVRLLLLERCSDPSWTDAISPETVYTPVIEQHKFGDQNVLGLEVKPLKSDAIVELMKRRILKAQLDAPEPSRLLSLAHSIDGRVRSVEGEDWTQLIPIPRPLFAIAAAEAIIDAKKKGQELPDRFESTKVLAGIVQRERDTRWREATQTGGELKRYEMGLAVATLAQGVSLHDLNEDNFGSGISWLPPIPPDHDSVSLSAFGYRDKRWPPMEPDFLGEFFVSEQFLDTALRKKHRVALIEGTLLLGESQSVNTLWRLAQDFPERFKQLKLEKIARATTHERVLLSLTSLVGNLPSDVLDSCASKIFDAVFEREDWKHSCELAILVAVAAVNISLSAGIGGDWGRVTEMVARLDALRKTFPGNQEIALADARAALDNIINFVEATRSLGCITEMETRLDALQKTFPEDKEIALAGALAIKNISGYSVAVGARGLVAEILAKLDALRKAFPEDKKIALEDAKVANNISNYAVRAGGWTHVAEMLLRLDAVRKTFPQDEEIAQVSAIAAFNICSSAVVAGDWNRVAEMLLRLDAVRNAFPQDEQIAHTDAMAALNIFPSAVDAGDWDRVAEVLLRLDAVRNAFPQDEQIALYEAWAADIISESAGAIGDWDLVTEMLSRLDALQKAFPQNEEIERIMAKAKFNHISRSRGKASNFTPHDGTFTHQGGKVGRNKPCPCGSGKKFKQCCGHPSKLN